jgi:alpha-glucuronidase
MQIFWRSLEGKIDIERFAEISEQLNKKIKKTIWWKEACLNYFQTFSKMPFPETIKKPIGMLIDYQKRSYKPF